MPQLPSMKKRLRQSRKLRVHNIWRREQMRSTLRAYETALAGGDAAEIAAATAAAHKSLDKAVKQGIMKANTASRRKARMSRMAAAASK